MVGTNNYCQSVDRVFCLTDEHQKDLESSGLTLEQIVATGHFSADQTQAQQLVGCKVPGLIFRYCDPSGNPYLKTDQQAFYRIKPDWGDRKTADSPKYLSPKDQGSRPYFSRLYPDWEQAIKSTKVELWETEGEKKADCGCAHGLAVIGFAGVTAWLDRHDRATNQELSWIDLHDGAISQELLESRPLPELSEIDWKHRKVYQCFDSDIIAKRPVQIALAYRAHVLEDAGAFPYLVLLPNELDGTKNGLDDFVVRHGIEALQALANIAQPTPYQVIKRRKGEAAGKTFCFLKLKEPESHVKAVMAWTVLRKLWAYRPGVGWYEWHKTHWQLRNDDEFEAVLTRFMDAQNWRQRGSGLMTSVVRELRSRLQVKDGAWNPFGKVVFSNGTLDTVSGQFIAAHNPFDRLTRLRPYCFNPSAQCPTWLKFIHEAMGGDPDLIKLIRAMFRYVVLPRPRNHKAEIEKSFDFFGQKGTGKGTTLDVLTNLIGLENIGSASVDTFKNSLGLGQLIDKDLAIDHDASGFLSNVGNYNKVVSNEPVEVKKLYKDVFIMRLGVVVVRAYNAFLTVPDGSEGLDRRLTIIPFGNQPKTTDTGLSQKLEAELSGIFAWCYSMPAREMKQRILSAGNIKAVAEISIERFEANNPEVRFLGEIFPEGNDRVKAGDLYQSYVTWCKENYHQPKSSVKFAAAIQNLGCQKSAKKLHGNWYYRIPSMSDCDIARHLGIVGGQLGDSYEDSSNLDVSGAGDSWGQFEPEKLESLNGTNLTGLEDPDQLIEERFPPQLSPTVPNPDPARLSTVPETVSQLSLCPTTVPIRRASARQAQNSSGIQVEQTVGKRGKRGWRGVVKSVTADEAMVLWHGERFPERIQLRELEVVQEVS